MQLTLTKHNPSNSRLILIFAGWAMDSRPFAGIERPGYDVAVVYDYRSSVFDYSVLARYGEIAVIAWSYGVFHANRTLAGRPLPITATIAVNGTLHPVDDTRGIPRKVFAMTLRAMSAVAVDKFNRRACGSDEAYASFMSHAPQRPVDEVIEELRTFDREYPEPHPTLAWNHIIVGGKDAIIDPRNQLNAWRAERCTVLPDKPHTIDLQDVVNRYIVAKDVVAKSFRRHAATYDDNAGVQERVAINLWDKCRERIAPELSHDRVIEIGPGTGLLTRQYIHELKYKSLELWDISGFKPDIDGLPQHCVVTCDAETAVRQLPDSCVDLLLSSATLQWFNDLPSFMDESVRVLRPGGYAAYAYFTSGTCREITELTGNSLAFSSLNISGGSVLFSDTETITELFDTPADVLRHLRMTGVNSLGNKHLPNHQIKSLIDRYPRTDSGKAPLTYRVTYLILHSNG